FVLPGSQWGGNGNVAFTSYLGVGSRGDSDFNGPTTGIGGGIFYSQSMTRIADITDGTSNTLMIGERPPSQDLYYGWWFAGAGYDGSGEGDVTLGANALNYAGAIGCGSANVGFQDGKTSNNCDQAHFWSTHPGGANFCVADGTVRFM